MKRFRRPLAFILSLCILFSLLPAVSAAGAGTGGETEPGQFVIKDLTISQSEPDAAKVRMIAEENCTLVVGLYTEEDRMLGVETAQVTGGAEEQTVSVPIPADRPEYFKLEAFLLDSASHAPLCESFMRDNAGNAGYDYSITALTADGSNISATVSTRNACTLSVRVLSEDEETVLFSTDVDVAENLEMAAVTAECTVTLPEHFLVRAVLQDEHGNELNNPFTNRHYTASYEAFEEQMETDFAGSTVLDLVEENDGNFAVLNDDVCFISLSANTNTLISRSEGTCTFADADESLSGLQVGDKLCFMDNDGQYATIKVGAVHVKDDGTVIITEDPNVYISDFYRLIKIDATLLNEAVAPQSAGNTYALARSVEVRNSATGDDLIDSSVNIEMGPAVSNEFDTPFGALEATVQAGGKLEVRYDPKLFGKDYMEFVCLAGLKAVCELSVGPNGPKEGEVKIPSIPLVGLKDVAEIPLDLALTYEVDGKMGLNATLTVEETAGIIYNTDDGSQKVRQKRITQDDVSMDTAVECEVECEVGLKMSLGASVLDDLMKVSLGAEAGAGIKGSAVALNDIIPTGSSSYHACGLCASGNTYGYMEVDMTACFEISPVLKGTLLDLDFVKLNWNIGTFYCSLINEPESILGGKITFDWAEKCPNKKYRVKVLTYDENEVEVADCTVSALDADGNVVDSGQSPFVTYLYPGEFTAQATVKGQTAKGNFAVSDSSMTVILRAEARTLSGTVTDRETGEPIAGAFVRATQNGEPYTSDIADADGRYTLELAEGEYTVTFSAEGYDGNSENLTFTENREMNAALSPTYYTIRFAPGEGSGEMSELTVRHGEGFTLPACSFDAPEEKKFKAWGVGGEERLEGETYSPVTDDMVVSAAWKALPTSVTITVMDPNGQQALSGATIEGTGLDAAPVTSSNGSVTVELDKGDYTLTATISSYYGYGAYQKVTIEEETQITLYLKDMIPEWSFDDSTKTLTLTGCGVPMMDFWSAKVAPWYSKRLGVERVEIYNVLSVGQNAFDEYTNLKSVMIPDCVTEIGYGAFSDTGLTEVTLPQNLESLDNYAFTNCDGLTSVTIPGSVTSMGKSVFANCDNLTSVEFLDGASLIGDGMFHGCAGLTSVKIPDSVTSIGANAFLDCTGLTSVTIPKGVLTIGENAFDGCTNLTDINIADGVTSIGNAAFKQCQALASVEIPGSVAMIGNEAFYECTNLASVSLSDGLISIGDSAFVGTGNLTSITLPDSLTAIGTEAFKGCDLTSVTIPGKVNAVGEYVFRDCAGLTSVKFLDGATTVGKYMFYNCANLTSVELPNSVTSIGGAAFCYCTLLSDINIPDGVTSIGMSAFRGCYNLTDVTVPDGVTNIGVYTFEGAGLVSITISDSVTSIGDNAFSACGDLKAVYYTGTEEQWNAISIGTWNQKLTNAEIHFNAEAST